MPARTPWIRGFRIGASAARRCLRGAVHPACALVLSAASGWASGTENATPAAFRLIDVAAELGVGFVTVTGDGAMDYIVEANGNGAALFDFDFDGDLDLLLVSGSTLDRFDQHGGHPMLALYRNEGASGFKEVTSASGLDTIGWGMGACVADYDRDGSADVYVTTFGQNLLFRNNGDGSFNEVARSAGVADAGWSHSCAFGDFDRDGDPDLYVANYIEFDQGAIPARGPDSPCNYRGFKAFCGPLGLMPQADRLYRNEDNGRFSEVEITAPARYAMGVSFSDLAGSTQADFFVTNDSQYNSLLRARSDGVVEESALLAGLTVNELGMPQASMGIAVGDYDNDLDLDLLVTNFSEDYNTLYQNLGQGIFVDFSIAAGVAQSTMTDLSWGALFVDLDQDGWLDLFVANGHVYENAEDFELGSSFRQGNRVFSNTRDGRLRDVTMETGGDMELRRSSRGLAAGDLDGDGDVDLVIVNLNDPPTILRNDTATENHSVRLELLTGPSRPDPIGTRLLLHFQDKERLAELTGGGSYLSHSELVGQFGVAAASSVDSLEVRPKVGRRLVLLRLPTGVTFVLDRRLPEDSANGG